MESVETIKDKVLSRILRRWSVDEKLGVLAIARLVGVRNGDITALLAHYEIPLERKNVPAISKEDLARLYIQQERTVDEIAEMLGLDESTVRYYMRKYGIKIFYKSRGRIQVPELHDYDLLYRLYIEQGMTMQDICNELNVSTGSLQFALRRLKIPSRRKGERKSNPYTARPGERNFTLETKKAILERDGHRCRMPDCAGTSKTLHIHHIVARHSGGGNDVSNGITICLRCHWKTFHKEEQFEKLFRSLIQVPLA